MSCVDGLNQQPVFLFYFNLYPEVWHIVGIRTIGPQTMQWIKYFGFSFGKIVLVYLKWTLDMILCADAAGKRVPKNKETESIWSAAQPGDGVCWQPCEVRRRHYETKMCLVTCLFHKSFVVSVQRIPDSSRAPASQWSVLLQFLWAPATETQRHPSHIHSDCSQSSFPLPAGNWPLILIRQLFSIKNTSDSIETFFQPFH